MDKRYSPSFSLIHGERWLTFKSFKLWTATSSAQSTNEFFEVHTSYNYHAQQSHVCRSIELTIAVFIERFKHTWYQHGRNGDRQHITKRLRRYLLLPTIVIMPCAQLMVAVLEIFDFFF